MQASEVFGDWIHHVEKLHEKFKNGQPYEHVVVPNFFSTEMANNLYAMFPEPLDIAYDWKHYDNPIEQKYTLNKFEKTSIFTRLFEYLQSSEVVELFKRVTGIENLEADPYLHGAGLHAYPTNGKLDVHLDYGIHPFSQKERRCNLIVYMNRNWRNAYGGHLQLWDANMKNCKEIIAPDWNTAILFRTSDISFHGIPSPIECPDGMYRKSIAIYYVSDARSNIPHRYKAEFFPLPSQPVDDRLAKLYEIRKQRLITQEDLQNWPNWRNEGYGHW
jgi:Rps23 Pro-64 3,4-dihydroxylase Tpa1-like proline 4-hydroxylase